MIEIEHPRCPYCHEQVKPVDTKQSCLQCMGWYHEECWSELQGCHACGQPGSARPSAPANTVERFIQMEQKRAAQATKEGQGAAAEAQEKFVELLSENNFAKAMCLLKKQGPEFYRHGEIPKIFELLSARGIDFRIARTLLAQHSDWSPSERSRLMIPPIPKKALTTALHRFGGEMDAQEVVFLADGTTTRTCSVGCLVSIKGTLNFCRQEETSFKLRVHRMRLDQIQSVSTAVLKNAVGIQGSKGVFWADCIEKRRLKSLLTELAALFQS